MKRMSFERLILQPLAFLLVLSTAQIIRAQDDCKEICKDTYKKVKHVDHKVHDIKDIVEDIQEQIGDCTVCEKLCNIEYLLEGQCKVRSICEARCIDCPGSYCLSNDIFGTIAIDADAVTLDLNGYSITPVDGNPFGIYVRCNRHNLNIKNGFLTFGGIFVDPTCSGLKISDLQILTFPAAPAIAMLGVCDFVIENCVARNGFGCGFDLFGCANFKVSNCVFDGLVSGIRAAEAFSFVVEDCVVQTCTCVGFDFCAAYDGVVQNCIVDQILSCSGFNFAETCDIIVDGCSAQSCAGAGFSFVNSYNCEIANCTAQNNEICGFYFDPSSHNVIKSCVAQNNGACGFYNNGCDNVFVNNFAMRNDINYCSVVEAPLTGACDKSASAFAFWKNYSDTFENTACDICEQLSILESAIDGCCS